MFEVWSSIVLLILVLREFTEYPRHETLLFSLHTSLFVTEHIESSHRKYKGHVRYSKCDTRISLRISNYSHCCALCEERVESSWRICALKWGLFRGHFYKMASISSSKTVPLGMTIITTAFQRSRFSWFGIKYVNWWSPTIPKWVTWQRHGSHVIVC